MLSNNLVETIKQVALAAVEQNKPVAVMIGTVTKTEPLCILVEQRMELPEGVLIFTRTARSRALQIEDTVLLIRVQGGQKFVVLDVMG